MNAERRRWLAEGERAGLRYAMGVPRQAPAGSAGGALGYRAGSSLEFRDYRDYQPGDDLRHIDWNAYARTDQLVVKLYREEVHPHVDVVVDGSRSMALEGSAKEAAALGLAAFFAAAAENAGFAHRVWRLAGRVESVPNGNGRPDTWAGPDFTHPGSPAEAFGQAPAFWRPRGVRVLISDLLWPGEPLLVLRQFAERAAVAVVVQVLAGADIDPPENEDLRLIDAETGQVREMFIDAAAARRYREALARHRQNWHHACRQTGTVFASVVAERLRREWNFEELVAAEVLRVV